MDISYIFQEQNNPGVKCSSLPIYDNLAYDDCGIIFDKPIYEDLGIIFDKPIYDNDVYHGLLEMKCQISVKYDDLLPVMKNQMFAKYEDVSTSILSLPKQNASYNDLLGNLSRKKSHSKSLRSEEDGYHFEYLMCSTSSIVLIIFMNTH